MILVIRLGVVEHLYCIKVMTLIVAGSSTISSSLSSSSCIFVPVVLIVINNDSPKGSIGKLINNIDAAIVLIKVDKMSGITSQHDGQQDSIQNGMRDNGNVSVFCFSKSSSSSSNHITADFNGTLLFSASSLLLRTPPDDDD
jgi:hypothetical protein